MTNQLDPERVRRVRERSLTRVLGAVVHLIDRIALLSREAQSFAENAEQLRGVGLLGAMSDLDRAVNELHTAMVQLLSAERFVGDDD